MVKSRPSLPTRLCRNSAGPGEVSRTAAAAGFPVWAVADPSAAQDEPEIRRISARYLESWEELATELETQTV